MAPIALATPRRLRMWAHGGKSADDLSVTDPKTMGVRGVEGLRVVDASVFPYVTNGNIYAPVMMTAEKAADLILGNTPLPAEPVEFYRHGESPSPLSAARAA